MKPHQVFLVCAAVVLVLALMPQPAAATDGDTSTASITSFSQTNPADGADFWPDGHNYTVTNSKMYEDFAGIGGWQSFSLGTGESKGTSGDYGYVRCKYITGTDDWSGMYSNRPSFTAASLANTYIEVRYRGNSTGQQTWMIFGYTGDGMTGTSWVIVYLTPSTSWTTYRALLPSTNALESVLFQFDIKSGQPALEFDVDYLLLMPSSAGGWQHDCSATGNTTGFFSSDGDQLALEFTFSSEGVFSIDGTATAAAMSPTYYPFVEINIADDVGGTWGLNASAGGTEYALRAAASGEGTFRYNIAALTSSGITSFTVFTATQAYGYYLDVDWIAMYGIANFTTTLTGASVNDLAYVSSNALVVTKSTATLFQFDRDPAISVAAATYQRWNVSTATPGAVGCSLYVAAWTTKDGESTWWMPSGTSTDVRIRVTASATISALKFLADSSAPVCVWSSATPSDPTTTDSVSLWAVITDSYALYKVYFRPITYPAGFSAVDYSATQQQNNLWLYTFSSLPLSGVYCFVVVGTDGANNNTLGATTYLTFTVREAEIIVTTITLFGAGDDFDFVTWTFDINRACTYTIREWSGTYAAADTWTGSVAEGIRNIAWPKLSLTDDYVNFTVTFVNGTLSYAFSSSYAMPKSTFYFESYLTGEGHKFNAEIVWCSGTLSKAATYTIYCDNTQVETGTVSEDFYVDIDKGLPKGQDHLYAFRFVNGSQTLWVNCTYYSYASDQDEPERGGTGVTTEEYWMRTLTVLTFIGICMIGIGVARIPNLPNYRGR